MIASYKRQNNTMLILFKSICIILQILSVALPESVMIDASLGNLVCNYCAYLLLMHTIRRLVSTKCCKICHKFY